MIFIDIKKRLVDYEGYVQEDLVTMQSLGMNKNLPEINAELAKRLLGKEVEEAADDQLYGEAARILPAEFD